MFDTESGKNSPRRPATRFIDRRNQFLGTRLRKALKTDNVIYGEPIEVSDVTDEFTLGELHHRTFPEAFNIHRTSARPVHDLLIPLEWALWLDAPRISLAICSHELALQWTLTSFWEGPRDRSFRALRQHGADHLRNDVTRFSHDHRVSRADVLDAHLIFVMKSCHRHRGTVDEDRFEHCERRRPTGSPDRHTDVQKCRRALFGRKLKRNCPTGCSRGVAECFALR